MRGNEARTQIKPTERASDREGRSIKGKERGEKRMVAVMAHIIKMFTYSAMNNRAKRFAPNSILKPETSSDSPSAKSKGVRFVSARMEINQVADKGKKRSRGGTGGPDRMDEKSKDRRSIRIEIRIRVIETSYEIVWATARRAPSRAYFELEAYPAKKIIYTFRLERHRRRSTANV